MDLTRKQARRLVRAGQVLEDLQGYDHDHREYADGLVAAKVEGAYMALRDYLCSAAVRLDSPVADAAWADFGTGATVNLDALARDAG